VENLAFSADLIRAIVDVPPSPHREAFDATGYAASAWPDSLKPVGAGAVQCEPFDEWWNRHKITLAHLHPMIAEQWIYRHWIWSPYRNLPLDQLVWRQESWKTRRILEEVFRRPQFGKLQPAFDYEVFHGKYFEPGRSMDQTGTWNYPIIVLSTPNGVKTTRGFFGEVRHCLIEGHQRVRYLNALSARSECAAEHCVFLLSIEDRGLGYSAPYSARKSAGQWSAMSA
jgi:hypothetical protein